MPELSATKLLIILLIVVLLFGSKKLPELAGSLGKSMQELRKGINGEVAQKKSASDTQKVDS